MSFDFQKYFNENTFFQKEEVLADPSLFEIFQDEYNSYDSESEQGTIKEYRDRVVDKEFLPPGETENEIIDKLRYITLIMARVLD